MKGLRTGPAVLVVVIGLLGVQMITSPAQATGGQLDSTFDGDGKVTTRFGPNSDDRASALVIQPDGRIVVAGSSGPWLGSRSSFALVRYNSDGSLDTSFGGDGKVTTHAAAQSTWDQASDVVLLADGRIVVVGSSDNRFALARFNSDGSLDVTFGGDGTVVTRFSPGSRDAAAAAAIQPDGRLMVVGGSEDRFALARYTASGQLDPSFGGDGKVTTRFPRSIQSWISDVALRPDGRILVSGWSWESENLARFALARYHADGSLDASFGESGRVTTQFAAHGEHEANAVELQTDRRIVAAGNSNYPKFAIARYRPGGALDHSFGGDGKVMTSFLPGSYDIASDVAIQADGKILVGGISSSAYDRFALARYDLNGRLDASFGSAGRVMTQFGKRTFGGAAAIAIQANGGIVAAGGAEHASSMFAVVRYLP